MRRIDWSARLIAIRGPRGVGKTTLMLQRLRTIHNESVQSLYLTLDDLYFTENRLIDVARAFDRSGGKVLFVDEVHKYPQDNWAKEIKNIYDLIPGIQVVFSGSSILQILHKQADLSRRVVIYEMAGLSLREFIMLKTGVSLPLFSIDDLFHRQSQVADAVIRDLTIKPYSYLPEYLKSGYYPFFLEGVDTYPGKLREMIKTVIEVDLNDIPEYTITDHVMIARLMYVIASSAPFRPNISKLSERIGLHRNRLVQYINVLALARLLNLLHSDRTGITALQKPDKIYLENTNIMWALAPSKVNAGHERETFVLSQLRHHLRTTIAFGADVRYPAQGDFLVDTIQDQYLLEIGGPSKSKRQVREHPNAYVVKDDIEFGGEHRIPLWMFGFLY